MRSSSCDRTLGYLQPSFGVWQFCSRDAPKRLKVRTCIVSFHSNACLLWKRERCSVTEFLVLHAMQDVLLAIFLGLMMIEEEQWWKDVGCGLQCCLPRAASAVPRHAHLRTAWKTASFDQRCVHLHYPLIGVHAIVDFRAKNRTIRYHTSYCPKGIGCMIHGAPCGLSIFPEFFSGSFEAIAEFNHGCFWYRYGEPVVCCGRVVICPNTQIFLPTFTVAFHEDLCINIVLISPTYSWKILIWYLRRFLSIFIAVCWCLIFGFASRTKTVCEG